MTILSGKVALISGGASGIGKATVRRFVREGAQVVFTDIDEDQGQELATEIGPLARFVRGDHTKPDDNRTAVDTAIAAFGGLHILHNNAGLGQHGAMGEVTEETLRTTIESNLIGPYLMTQAALPALRKSATDGGGAVILFTASSQSLMVRPHMTVYGATKHGIGGLIGSLALELAPEGIRVNGICPGPVYTQLFRDSIKHLGDTPAVAERFTANVPLGRFIKPEEIAAAAVFLCGAEASAITGVLLPVDGGQTTR